MTSLVDKLKILGMGTVMSVVSTAGATIIPSVDAPTKIIQGSDVTAKFALSNIGGSTTSVDWKFYASPGVTLNSYGKPDPSSSDFFNGKIMSKDLISNLDVLSSRIAGSAVINGSGDIAKYNFTASGTAGTTGQFSAYAMKVNGAALSPSSTVSNFTIYSKASPSVSTSNLTLADVVVGATPTGSFSLSNSAGTYVSPLQITGTSSSGGVSMSGVAVGDKLTQSTTRTINVNGATGIGAYNGNVVLQSSDDQTYSGWGILPSKTVNVSGKVLDHSQLALSTTAVNFNVLKGATIAPVQVGISNADAAYRTGLDATLNATGDGAISISNTNSISNLAKGGTSNRDISLSAANYGNFNKTLNVIAGDTTVGNIAGSTTGNQTAHVVVSGNVGQAVADRSNSASSFGSSLIAELSAGQSYSGLESYVLSSTGSGGASALGSKATILSGTASNATTVSEKWRARTQNEALTVAGSSVMPTDAYNLVSDVVNISGVPDQFTLKMTYDPSQLVFKGGNTEFSLADKGAIYIATRDSNGNWVYTGTNQVVDTVNHTVTATLDHNSDFAVVPEPGTLALLGLGGLGLFARGRRRKESYSVPFTKEEIRADIVENQE